MENPDPSSNHSRRTLRRSGNSHISMSDTESTTYLSPRSSDSPFRSDDPSSQHENDNQVSKSSKSDEKYYSPAPSPGKFNPQASSSAGGGRRSNNRDFPAKGNSLVVLGRNRLAREEPQPGAKRLGPPPGGRRGGLEEGNGGGALDEVGGERQSRAAVEEILRKSERSAAVMKTALMLRVFEVIACLISFSVMAADRTQGWSGDSFDRYKEYRYCLAVNVIGFAYSGFQAYDLAYHWGNEKHVISHHLRYHFAFSMDQILAYLLMSASSSAATRVTDWILNWGKDEFTLLASASIAMSFLAFVGFAFSSLISGSNLCNRDSS